MIVLVEVRNSADFHCHCFNSGSSFPPRTYTKGKAPVKWFISLSEVKLVTQPQSLTPVIIIMNPKP